jgi:pyridoxal 5'-phosphate synthase pdxT subunit
MRIGILALQGAVAEHKKALTSLDVEAVEVRLPRELENVDALVIPGGESTTISKLLAIYELSGPLKKRIEQGFPVLGTCAGMILLARDIVDSDIEGLGVMDISVRRNAYGRQIDSFENELEIPVLGRDLFPGVFIRAPIVESVKRGVQVLSKVDGSPVAVKQGKMLACTFHPELTEDLRFHRYFLGMV